MSIFSEKNLDIPTYAKEVYDVTGAGDTVLATLAMAISAGANLKEAATLANFSAEIKVSKKGTYSVGLRELIQKVNIGERKILTLEELKKIILDLKKKGKSRNLIFIKICRLYYYFPRFKLLKMPGRNISRYLC